jgi:capsular exopolysaccharide synthesis family protein
MPPNTEHAAEIETGTMVRPDTDNEERWIQASRNGELVVSGPTRNWVFQAGDELFRGIYTHAATGFTNEVLAVCSAISGEGRTTVGVGMAVTIAQDFPNRRVLLVETDPQRAVIADDFGVEASPGLVDCLVDDEPLQAACRPTHLDNLHIVPWGSREAVPGRPLRSSQMAAVVEDMRQAYDIVILDLPPILVNSDAVLLTDLADGTIYVVRAGVTPITLVNRALEQLDEAKLRGVVLNGAKTSIPGWLGRLVGV